MAPGIGRSFPACPQVSGDGPLRVPAAKLAQRDQERYPAAWLSGLVIHQDVGGGGLAAAGVAQQHRPVDLLANCWSVTSAGRKRRRAADDLDDGGRYIQVGDRNPAAVFEVWRLEHPVILGDMPPVPGQKVGFRPWVELTWRLRVLLLDIANIDGRGLRRLRVTSRNKGPFPQIDEVPGADIVDLPAFLQAS